MSRRYRDYTCWVGGEPYGDPVRWPQVAQRSFHTARAARAWADTEHPDAPLVNLKMFNETAGALRQVATRKAGGWFVRDPFSGEQREWAA